MSERDEEREGESRGFRVVDRRRFTASGDVRGDVEREPEPAEPAPAAKATGAPERREVHKEPRHVQAEAREPKTPPAAGPESRIDFLTFAASLATNALAAMGALPEAEAQGLPKSPELAREYIEILAMLQQKTRGNLTRQEEQALQQLLTELRMQFVELGKRR